MTSPRDLEKEIARDILKQIEKILDQYGVEMAKHSADLVFVYQDLKRVKTRLEQIIRFEI